VAALRRHWLRVWLAVELLVVLPLGISVLSLRRNLAAVEPAHDQARWHVAGPGPPSGSMGATITGGALARTGQSVGLLLECADRAGVAIRSLVCSGVERGGRLCITVGISAQSTKVLTEFLREVRRCLPVTVGLEKLDFFDQSRDVSFRLDWARPGQGVGQ